MRKTKLKTFALVLGAMLLSFAGIIFSGIQFPLTDSYFNNSLTVLPHLIFIALLFGWVISVNRRIINKRICHYLIAVGLLMIFWLTVRTTKWFFISQFDDLCRYLWYAFYIPMILIPLLGVFITHYIGKPEHYKMPATVNLLLIPAFLLIVFVFTNDFHRLVFKFPNGIKFFNSDYTYGFGFYIVCAWFIFFGFYFVIELIIKSRVPGSKTFQKMPLIIMGISVIFWLLYSLKLIKADLTAVDCLMITLLLESAIQSGLIRSNTGYTELFEISTISALVVDKNYQARYISAYADDLPEDIMKQAIAKPLDLGKSMLCGKPVSGGYVLWQNDIRKIKQLMKNLEETRERLSENNYLLKAEIDIREQKARFDEKNRLYDRIASDVSSQLDSAQALLETAVTSPENARHSLSRICVLSAYIKRRSNLLLLGEESEKISSHELVYCIRESLDNLRLLGVAVSFESDCSGEISVDDAVYIYDIFQKIIEQFLDNINASMVFLTCKPSSIILKMQYGCDNCVDGNIFDFIDKQHCKFSCDIDETDVSLRILLEEGGERND